MNLSSTIHRLGGNQRYVVTRFGASTYVNGIAQPPHPTTLSIEALIVPIDIKELQRLPEGERSIGTIRIFSLEELRLANVATGTIADRITYRGVQYEVECVEPWDEIAGFWRASARKVPL